MNNTVPDWNFGSDISGITNQKKHMGLDHEFVELLWQNGQVVLQSQTNRKPPLVNSINSRQVQKNHQSTLRTNEPFEDSSNLIQDDETVSWINYPLEDPLEQELCSDLLSELSPCDVVVESYKQIRQFEEGKFSKLDGSTMKPSFVQEFSGIPIPPQRFHVPDPSPRNNDLDGSGKVLNFSHFSAQPNIQFREKTSANMSKECSGMTVGSSYCGSNHVPQDRDVSMASSNGIRTRTTNLSAEPKAAKDDVQRTIPQIEKGKSEMLEPTLTSSSGGSGSSLDKTGSLSTKSQGQKRKGRDIEESLEQSEGTELKSATANKVSQRSGSTRRNRAAEVHNLSERKRRDRINEKMRALQQLIPHSSKTDKASMLEEAIEYLKSLQFQLQVMWMGSGMTPMMLPGFQHYMSQMGMGMGMGMGMATSSFPQLQNPMQLPNMPLDQSVSASQAPNHTLMCQSPMLGAFNYPNQMQNPALSEQYARYMGYHLMQNTSQPMNMYRYGPQVVQHSQPMIPPSNSSGPLSAAVNIDDSVSDKMG